MIFFLAAGERISSAFVLLSSKSHNSGFKRLKKMIETRKYSTLKGPICNRDYNDTPSISWYFTANKFDFFSSQVCKHGA